MLEDLINKEANAITDLKRDIYQLELKLDNMRNRLKEHEDLLAKLETLREEEP